MLVLWSEESLEFGESSNGSKVLTRSCVIVRVLVSVRLLRRCPYLVAYRNGR